MKRVYVAGPISADNTIDALKNIGRGEAMCGSLFMMGYAPFCPFFDKDYIIRNFSSKITPDQLRKAGMAWLEVSECILVLEGSEKSVGVQAEIARAEELNIPVYRSFGELISAVHKR